MLPFLDLLRRGNLGVIGVRMAVNGYGTYTQEIYKSYDVENLLIRPLNFHVKRGIFPSTSTSPITRRVLDSRVLIRRG